MAAHLYKSKILFHRAEIVITASRNHTFATTVTPSNNVPIEPVSKCSPIPIKATQHYAKLLDSRLATDMDLLQHKLQVKFDLANSRSGQIIV